jgi:hypothetical protein
MSSIAPRTAAVVAGSRAAPESNRPSRGLHDRTGFEDLRRERQLATVASFWPRSGRLRSGEVRLDQ